jgi:hypothetical protein
LKGKKLTTGDEKKISLSWGIFGGVLPIFKEKP